MNSLVYSRAQHHAGKVSPQSLRLAETGDDFARVRRRRTRAHRGEVPVPARRLSRDSLRLLLCVRWCSSDLRRRPSGHVRGLLCRCTEGNGWEVVQGRDTGVPEDQETNVRVSDAGPARS